MGSRAEQGRTGRTHTLHTHKESMRMTAGSHKSIVSKCAESLGVDPVLCGLIRRGHSCLNVFSSTSRYRC